MSRRLAVWVGGAAASALALGVGASQVVAPRVAVACQRVGFSRPLSDAECAAIASRAIVALSLAMAAAVLVVFALTGPLAPLSAQVRRFRESHRRLVADVREGLARPHRRELWALAVVTLIGMAVRLEFIHQPARYDEAYTFLKYVSRPWYQIPLLYTLPNNHIFHSFLAKAAVSALGAEPWVLRVPALVAGVALVPATYVAGRMLYGSAAGLLAAAVVAGSAPLTLYSTNARGYTIICLAFVALVALAASIMRRPGLAAWSYFVLVAVIGLYTIPIMLYPFGAVCLWLGASGMANTSRRRAALHVGVAGVVVGGLTLALYAPALVAVGWEPVGANQFVVPAPWREFLSELPGWLAGVARDWSAGVPRWAAWAGAALAVVGVVGHRLVGKTRHSLPLVALAWCVIVLLANHRLPYGRVWLFLLPAVAIAIGAGVLVIARLVRRMAGAAAPPVGEPAALRPRRLAIGGGTVAATAVAAALGWSQMRSRAPYWADDTGTLRDAAAIARDVAPVLRDGGLVLATLPSDAPLQYALASRGLDPARVWSPDAGHPAVTAAGGRVLVVVNDREGETLAEALAPWHLRPGPQVALVRRYPFASVYEVRRQ